MLPNGTEKTRKTRYIAGFLLILLLGFVLSAGCSFTGSPGTPPQPPVSPPVPPQPAVVSTTATPVPAATTVALPAPQVVSEVTFVSPAKTPAPVRTTAANPTLQIVSEVTFVSPAKTPTPDPTATGAPQPDSSLSGYHFRPAVSPGGVTGTLAVRVTGCSSDKLTIFIARAGMNVSPVDDQELLDRMMSGDPDIDFLLVKFLPDGSTEPVKLAPGTYIAYLPDKAGDEIEEQQSFIIGANIITYLSFNGASYATPGTSSRSSCRKK